ncbi:MAG: hypothetical protein JRG89_09565 [Deltaproteobacteria bacterium]|nr:hypothetical protein [Deltaproteobacteria bacterium]
MYRGSSSSRASRPVNDHPWNHRYARCRSWSHKLDRHDAVEATTKARDRFHPRRRLEQRDRRRPISALDHHDWNIFAAARSLGVSRDLLRRRITSSDLW